MAKDELKKGERAALVSVAVSFILAVLKAAVGFWSGAIVLVSDALDSAADIFTSLASFIGLRISQRKPTEKFPFGFYKAENFASLFISGLIIYGAINLLIQGVNSFFDPVQINHPGLTLLAVLVSGIAALLMSKYLKRKGEEINSESLIANSKDRFKDVFTAIAVFISILLTHYNVLYAQGAVTIVISVLIIRMGLITARDSVYSLMDVSPNTKVEKKVKEILTSISGVESYSELRLRKAGPFIFGQVKVRVRKFVDVSKAHEVADRIEHTVKEKIPQIESLFIHIEPFKPETLKIAVPVKNDQGLNSTISNHLGRAEMFFIAETKNKKVHKNYTIKNPFKEKEVRAGLSASKHLVKQKIDVLITKEAGEISLHTLRDNLVDVYSTDYKRVRYTLDAFMEEKLNRLEKPTRRKE